jgi:hypothetical protein
MRSAQRDEPKTIQDARRGDRYRVRLYADRVLPGEPSGGFTVIYDLSRTGFLTEAVPHHGIGDRLRLQLPTVGVIDARIVRQAEGLFGCEFVEPLTPGQLLAARAGSKVIWPEFGGDRPRDTAEQRRDVAAGEAPTATMPTADEIDTPDRWPKPVRTAIWIGGAAALWGLIALAIT